MRRATRAAPLALSAAAVALTLAATELVLRLGPAPSWFVPADPDHDGLLAPHPTRGYALAPNTDRQWTRADWSIRVRTNAAGLRDAPLDVLRSADVRILAAGDSFTMGIGVEVDDTWPRQLQRLLAAAYAPGRRVAVANTGVPGYSTRQIRLAIEEWLPILEPQAVVVAFYASSFWRNANPYELLGPHLVLANEVPRLDLGADGSLVRTDFERAPARDLDAWLKRHTHLGGRLMRLVGDRVQDGSPAEADPPVREAFQPALQEILRTRDFCAERGVPFVVLVVNHQQPDGSFSDDQRRYSDIVADFCREHAITCFDPTPELTEPPGSDPAYRFQGDMHWSAAAQRVAARGLRARLEPVLPLAPGR